MRISKRAFHENKTRQIFQETNISYPQIYTRPFALLLTKCLLDLFENICFNSYTNEALDLCNLSTGASPEEDVVMVY